MSTIPVCLISSIPMISLRSASYSLFFRYDAHESMKLYDRRDDSISFMVVITVILKSLAPLYPNIPCTHLTPHSSMFHSFLIFISQTAG